MSTVQTTAGIVLVFGLLALFYWVAYRYSAGRGFSGRRQQIEILETRGIGDKRALLLIRVGLETFLVGSTTHQISLLSPIDSEPLLTETEEMEAGSLEGAAADGVVASVGASPTKGFSLPRIGTANLPARPSFRRLLEMFR